MTAAAHMWPMTEPSTAKADFAPAWPYVYDVPGPTSIVPPYERVSAFNHSLTAEQLKPLTDKFPAPGRRLFRTAGIAYMWVWALQTGLWLVTLIMDGIFSGAEVSEDEHRKITDIVHGTFGTVVSVGFWATIVALLLAVLGAVQYFVAWTKWRASLAAAWEQYDGRIVRTRDLPSKRRETVSGLGSRLDPAMKRLDALNLLHCHLVADATYAIGRYIDLPSLGKDSRRVAESDVEDESVQKVRDGYETATAAEKVTLEVAEMAVLAIETCARGVKAAASEQKIIDLAKSILERSAS